MGFGMIIGRELERKSLLWHTIRGAWSCTGVIDRKFRGHVVMISRGREASQDERIWNVVTNAFAPFWGSIEHYRTIFRLTFRGICSNC